MRLIVNADDAGYCLCRNRGIRHCVDHGVVTSFSVLVTHLSVSDVASLSVASPQCSVGLHLNLTEGTPLAHPVPTSLVDPATNRMWGKFGLRERLDQIDPDDVRRETRAQIERFEQLFNRLPSHLDGHQHAHTFAETATPIAQTMREKGIRWTRLARQKLPEQLTNAFKESVRVDAELAAQVYLQHGVSFPRHFFGLATQTDEETVIESFKQLAASVSKSSENGKDGCDFVVEWMVHPGYPCETVAHNGDDFNASDVRGKELQLLTSTNLRNALHEIGITLISYNELKE